jgi:hypothetical protein
MGTKVFMFARPKPLVATEKTEDVNLIMLLVRFSGAQTNTYAADRGVTPTSRLVIIASLRSKIAKASHPDSWTAFCVASSSRIGEATISICTDTFEYINDRMSTFSR